MGVNEEGKDELVAYQLKDVAQECYKMQVYARAPGEVPISWDILMTVLSERFFSRYQREDKVKEFISLSQGGM